MATDIGSIRAKIELDTTEYRQSVEKAKRQTEELGDGADKAKRKFEGLESALTAIASSAALGGFKQMISSVIDESNRLYNAMQGLIEVSKALGQDVDEVTRAAQDLAAKGFMSVAEASQALKTTLAMGLGLEESIKLINAMADAAAYNRQAHYSWGEAIVVSIEGIKNQNSVMTDAVGVTKNLSVMYDEYAKSIGKTAATLSDAEKVQAAYNGFLKESEIFAGNAQVALEGYVGTAAKFDQQMQMAKATIGDGLKPVLQEVMNVLTPLIVDFTKWASENKEVIAGLTAAGVTVTGLIAILTTATVVVRGLTVAFTALNASLGPIGIALSVVGLGAAALLAYKSASDVVTESTLEQVQAQRDQIAELDNLIARFDTLKDKPNKTAEEMAELRDVQNELVKINPTLADGYDEVGNAMINASDKAKELSESMKQQLYYQAQSAYYDALTNIEKAQMKLNDLNDELADKQAHIRSNEEGILAIKEEIAKVESDSSIPNREQLLELLKQEKEGLELTNSELATSAHELAKKVTEQRNYVDRLNDALNVWKDINREIRNATIGTQTSEYLANEKLESMRRERERESQSKTVAKTTTAKSSSSTVGRSTSNASRQKPPHELADELYRQELKVLDFKRYMNQLSEQEEIAALKRMLSRYGKYADIRMDIEIRIRRLERQLAEEAERMAKEKAKSEEERIRNAFEFSRQWISDEEMRMKRAGESEDSIAKMKIESWTRVRNRYAENTEYYRQADRALYDAQMDLLRLQTKAREDAIKRLSDALRDQERAIKDYLNDTISSLREQERNELDSIERRKQAELDAIDERKRAIEKYYDDQISALEEQERQDNRKEIEAEIEKYRYATSKEGKAKLRELEKQLQKMNIEDQKRSLQEQKRNELNTLEDRRRTIQTYYDTLKQATQSHYQSLIAAFQTYSNDISNIENIHQDGRLSKFLSTNSTILAELRKFVDEYNRIVSQMAQISAPSTSGGGGYSGGGGGGLSVIELMQRNSAAWHSASEVERRRLEEENMRLGESQGWTRKSDGHWYDSSGRRVYHKGKDSDSLGNFRFGDRLLSDEILAIIRRNEYVFTPQQLSSLIATIGGRNDKPSVINNFNAPLIAHEGDVLLEDESDVRTYWKERDLIAQRLMAGGDRP